MRAGQRGATCNRQPDHPYTQAWSGSSIVPDRPPHRGEGHGQKERQEGAEGQEGAEEAVRAGCLAAA